MLTETKKVFDKIYQHKAEIESELSDYPILWERLDEKVTCRIRTDRDLQFTSDSDKITIFEFLMDSSKKFLTVFAKFAQKASK